MRDGTGRSFSPGQDPDLALSVTAAYGIKISFRLISPRRFTTASARCKKGL